MLVCGSCHVAGVSVALQLLHPAGPQACRQPPWQSDWPQKIGREIVNVAAGLSTVEQIHSMVSYDALARSMSDHPELLILRSYSSLNIKSLLYYEAELAHLEVELCEVESEDRDCGSSPRRDFATDWRSLSTGPGHATLMKACTQPRNERDALQWQIMCRIRSVLRDYNEAVAQYAKMSTLLSKSPSKDLRGLRKWLERPGYGDNFLRGKVESVWDEDKGFPDLCSFEGMQSANPGPTAYLSSTILRLKRRWDGSSRLPNHVYALDERTQEWIASGVMTVVSSVFPVLPIVILFFVRRLLVRLGLILVFTAIFAGALVFGMRLEPDKTLAITTAFAAIQVVFVGSTSNSPAA